MLEKTAAAQAKTAVQAPRFEVDPMWPKPLPNHWVIGNVIGVGVDAQDHVYIIHRGAGIARARRKSTPPRTRPPSECCLPAPPVLEFDADGNLVHAWGGPGAGYEWPESNHGITPDAKGNVWIGGNGGNDGHILKFTQGRQVHQAVRLRLRERRQQRHLGVQPGREDLARRAGQRGLRRPTATATSASP